MRTIRPSEPSGAVSPEPRGWGPAALIEERGKRAERRARRAIKNGVRLLHGVGPPPRHLSDSVGAAL